MAVPRCWIRTGLSPVQPYTAIKVTTDLVVARLQHHAASTRHNAARLWHSLRTFKCKSTMTTKVPEEFPPRLFIKPDLDRPHKAVAWVELCLSPVWLARLAALEHIRVTNQLEVVKAQTDATWKLHDGYRFSRHPLPSLITVSELGFEVEIVVESDPIGTTFPLFENVSLLFCWGGCEEFCSEYWTAPGARILDGFKPTGGWCAVESSPQG